MIRNTNWIEVYKSANPQKERDMEEPIVLNNDFRLEELKISIPQSQRIIFDKFAPNETELVLGDDFEMKEEGGVFKVVRKEKKYPKTYEECCKVLRLEYIGIKRNENNYSANCYKNNLICAFVELLICRDAYWKIAGEEMGLGKAWEPDWDNGELIKHCIYTYKDVIHKGSWHLTNTILAFPTEKMRDAFRENFGELIEECKELL